MCMDLEAQTVLTMKIPISWDVTLCSLEEIYLRFVEIDFLQVLYMEAPL